LIGGGNVKKYLIVLLFGIALLGSELALAATLDTTGYIFVGDGKQEGYGYSLGLYQTLVEGIVGSYSEYFIVPYPIKQVTQVAFFKINRHDPIYIDAWTVFYPGTRYHKLEVRLIDKPDGAAYPYIDWGPIGCEDISVGEDEIYGEVVEAFASFVESISELPVGSIVTHLFGQPSRIVVERINPYHYIVSFNYQPTIQSIALRWYITATNGEMIEGWYFVEITGHAEFGVYDGGWFKKAGEIHPYAPADFYVDVP